MKDEFEPDMARYEARMRAIDGIESAYEAGKRQEVYRLLKRHIGLVWGLRWELLQSWWDDHFDTNPTSQDLMDMGQAIHSAIATFRRTWEAEHKSVTETRKHASKVRAYALHTAMLLIRTEHSRLNGIDIGTRDQTAKELCRIAEEFKSSSDSLPRQGRPAWVAHKKALTLSLGDVYDRFKSREYSGSKWRQACREAGEGYDLSRETAIDRAMFVEKVLAWAVAPDDELSYWAIDKCCAITSREILTTLGRKFKPT